MGARPGNKSGLTVRPEVIWYHAVKFGPFAFRLIESAVWEISLDTGDTAWMLTSTAFVLFMTLPGLAMVYAGLVQS